MAEIAVIVIEMEMREDEVVNFFEARDLGGFVNATGIAFAGISGIDENGFSGGSNDLGRAAAFHVVPINVERMSGGLIGGQAGGR